MRKNRLTINDLINEELRRGMDARHKRDDMIRRSYVNEFLLERGGSIPDASRVDSTIVGTELNEKIDDLTPPISKTAVKEFGRKVVPIIARIMTQHAMTYVKIDPRTFASNLAYYDNSAARQAAARCAQAIDGALKRYAVSLGRLAVDMMGGGAPDSEEK